MALNKQTDDIATKNKTDRSRIGPLDFNQSFLDNKNPQTSAHQNV